MVQSRHIGKIVVDMYEQDVPVLERCRELRFQKQATYYCLAERVG